MRYLSLFFVLVLCIPMVHAQDFSLGAKAGLTIASQSVNGGSGSYSMKPGFLVGAYFAYTRNKLVVQADMVYTQQGADIESQGQNLSSTFSYFNFPVTAKYQVVSTFNVQIGPQIGLLTCAKSDFHPVTGQPYAEQTYTKAYKPLDFGLNLGAGWTDPGNTFSVDVRYYLGLTTINDYPGVADTKNSVISLSVGYRLKAF
jgi:Outer membrane protein beta-barrel domain